MGNQIQARSPAEREDSRRFRGASSILLVGLE